MKIQKAKYSNVLGSLQRNRRNKVIPNMPNVDKSQHLNKLLTSKLKHIVLLQDCKYLKGFIQYQNEVYATYER